MVANAIVALPACSIVFLAATLATQQRLHPTPLRGLTLERTVPFFATITETVGQTAGHTDVSLWYVLRGKSGQTYAFDQSEFRKIAWFALSNLPLGRADPHLSRFASKLRQVLDA